MGSVGCINNFSSYRCFPVFNKALLVLVMWRNRHRWNVDISTAENSSRPAGLRPFLVCGTAGDSQQIQVLVSAGEDEKPTAQIAATRVRHHSLHSTRVAANTRAQEGNNVTWSPWNSCALFMVHTSTGVMRSVRASTLHLVHISLNKRTQPHSQREIPTHRYGFRI